VTPEQIELARHALGLPNRYRRSYRNRFVAGDDHADYPAWMAMVEAGAAKKYEGAKLQFGGCHLFVLTPAGAIAALKPRESLDPEDFPAL
jgi:hypothetical protein